MKNILMMTASLVSGMLITASVAQAADNRQLDPGGVSVDFAKIKHEKTVSNAPNLIKNGSFEQVDAKGKPKKGTWFRSWHVHSLPGKQAEAKALIKKADSTVITTTATENPPDGKRYAKYITPASVNAMRSDPKNGLPMISNGFGANIAVPVNDKATKYLLSFMLCGKLAKVPGLNKFVIVVSFKGGSDKVYKCKSTGKGMVKHVSMTGNWSKITVPVQVPAKTTFVSLYLKLYGGGEANIDDVKLQATKSAPGVTVKLMPLSLIDNTYCLASGVPGIIGFACRNEAGVKITKPWLYLKLPAKVDILDVRVPLKIRSSQPIKENGQDYTLYKVELVNYGKAISKTKYNTWSMPALLIKTTISPGANFNAFYQFVDGDYSTAWQSFKLKIIPDAGTSPAPKLFSNATMFATEANFPTPAAAATFADFYNNAGFNSIHGGLMPVMKDQLKQAGINRYTQDYYICNGYRIGPSGKPKDVLFKLADGSYRTSPREAICPVEVYTQGKYYREVVIPQIRKTLVKNDYNSIMSNWEPYMFDFKGCFCDRCKAEFIKYSGISAAEVDQVWPKDVLIKYRDKWVKFRNWQHGKLVTTLEETCKEIGKTVGKDSHFIPEVAWSHMIEAGNNQCEQYDPREYMANLKVIEPWGPYIFYNPDNNYIYNSGIHLITYYAGKTIKDYVKKYVPDATKRPELIAFPHGLQLNKWVTEPEAIAFEMICYLVNGWNGAFVYYFPRGYDSRWWNALIVANRDIAAYENFIFNGKRIKQAKLTPITPLPPSNMPDYWAEGGNFVQRLPMLKDAKMIEHEEFILNNKRLITVGNFWQKGENFFKLSLNDLRPEARYVVSQSRLNRCFTPDDKRIYWTGKELQAGILLHVGALRWAFYTIEPYNEKLNYATKLNQQFMRSEMQRRLPTITKAVKWEKNYLKKLSAQTAKATAMPDYSNMQAMSNGSLSCKVTKLNNVPALQFSYGKEKITVSPLGGQIRSWINAGQEYIDREGLAGDAFWWPRSAVSVSCITTPYKLISQSKTATGLQVVWQRQLTGKDSTALTGATLQKTYDFSKNGGVSITTTIINSTDQNIRFSYRRRSMINYMSIVNEKRGAAAMGETVFERTFMQKLYRYTAVPDKDIEKVFNMDRIMLAKGSKVVFSAPWLKSNLQFSVGNPKQLHGFVFWDSMKQQCATFEPIFRKTIINLGGKWSITTKWKSINK
ncbi:MAG: hypothetical protein L3J71_11845 [Victivallaceae bacterium]|nr:hypothetical protein [Victivallaceae bacterium]